MILQRLRLFTEAIALALVASVIILPGPAVAQTRHTTDIVMLAADHPETRYLDVILALRNQGYRILSVRETFLRRVLIRVENPVHLREIVVSRASGSILRDIIVEEYTSVRRWTDEAPPPDINILDIDPGLFAN
ncbi:hypothetical protein [Natronohydrobacter thiooxidans]|uniref:hypothetical protein n=1 Tax=Natronohydrobacter thiooxidans TaxID=87172 RepID=UPI000AABEE6B|nr:hypothetical protein [Natronohydrobacter thiooxidans]